MAVDFTKAGVDEAVSLTKQQKFILKYLAVIGLAAFVFGVYSFLNNPLEIKENNEYVSAGFVFVGLMEVGLILIMKKGFLEQNAKKNKEEKNETK